MTIYVVEQRSIHLMLTTDLILRKMKTAILIYYPVCLGVCVCVCVCVFVCVCVKSEISDASNKAANFNCFQPCYRK